MVVNLESWANQAAKPQSELRLGATVNEGRITSWKVTQGEEKTVADSTDAAGSANSNTEGARVALLRIFEFCLPLAWLSTAPLGMDKVQGLQESDALTTRIRLRFSVWQNHLPVDALPVEGWIELELLAEGDLMAVGG